MNAEFAYHVIFISRDNVFLVVLLRTRKPRGRPLSTFVPRGREGFLLCILWLVGGRVYLTIYICRYKHF